MIIMNRKGFTMIELLAALVILGLLMAVAAPNIMGVLNKNRNTTYVEDAQKLASRAEYVLRGDPKIDKPSSTTCIGFSLGYLDNSEFTNPPYGGAYYANASFVVVERKDGEYKYYVQLIENLCKKPGSGDDCQDGSRGVKFIDVESLSSGNPADYVSNVKIMDDISNFSDTNLGDEGDYEGVGNQELCNGKTIFVYTDAANYPEEKDTISSNV